MTVVYKRCSFFHSARNCIATLFCVLPTKKRRSKTISRMHAIERLQFNQGLYEAIKRPKSYLNGVNSEGESKGFLGLFLADFRGLKGLYIMT